MTHHSDAPSESTRSLALAGIALVVLAWAIYRPDQARPFDILDFGEFLPFLKRTSSFSEQIASLIEYNARQSGRVNLVPVFGVVLKWRLFADWTPGWQLTRAALMLALTGQVYFLARRLGTTRLGGLVAASTFLVAPAAVRGWVRLTMGEPIGMLAIFAVSFRALRFQEVDAWRREVALFCLLAAFVVLVKELMAPAVAFPLALALVWGHDGRVARPALSTRNVTLVAATGLATLAALLPLVLLFMRASSSALASQYGQSELSGGKLFAIWFSTLAPFPLGAAPPSPMWALAFVLFGVLVIVGWWRGFRDPETRPGARWLLALALLFPVLGATSYLPWPAYEERYAFPYLAATALLTGFGATYLQRSMRPGRAAVVAGWTVIWTYAATAAMAHASRADAVQRTADALVDAVAGQRGRDSVFVATARAIEPAWAGLGPTLARLAAATNRPWPPTREIRCAQIPDHRRDPHSTVVSFATHCPSGGAPAQPLVHRFRRMEWSRWRVVEDSVRADVYRPEPAAAGLDAVERPATPPRTP